MRAEVKIRRKRERVEITLLNNDTHPLEKQ
jgi:hypothetical protein